MSDENITYMKKNWLTFSNIIVLIGFIVYQAQWQQSQENTDSTLLKDIQDHKDNETLHMPFKDKIEVFMPRVELDSRLGSIEKTLEKIEEKIK